MIPKAARDIFDLKSGDRLIVLGDEKEGIALVKAEEFEEKMRKGYLFASKDGAFSFAEEVPGVFEKADKAKGFVKITPLKAGHRTNIAVECCDVCHLVMLEY